nr:MCP four helix bundle domain-containing protein [Achromobacter sp.]
MKNLTLRQRILASFLVILAIMALMVVVDYRRLLHVEAEVALINTDAVPGIYYSTSIRASWFAGFVVVQDAYNSDTDQERRTALEALPKNDQQLEENIASYRRTISREDDRKMFEDFEKELLEYKHIRTEILAAAAAGDGARTQARIKSELRPAFYKGRDILANMVAENKKQADEAAVSIQNAVQTAEAGMLISLALAIAAAIVCGFLLMRAIANPMRDIVSTLESTGGGRPDPPPVARAQG